MRADCHRQSRELLHGIIFGFHSNVLFRSEKANIRGMNE